MHALGKVPWWPWWQRLLRLLFFAVVLCLLGFVVVVMSTNRVASVDTKTLKPGGKTVTDDDTYPHHTTERQQRHHHRNLEPNLNFDLNVLVLLLQFTNHQNREPLPDPYEYQIMLNLRAAQYLEENSYGTMSVWFDVIPWQMTDESETYYANAATGPSGQGFETQLAFHPLLDNMLDSGFDFSPHDANNDGKIDNLIVLTTSYDAALPGPDEDGTVRENRIWSFASSGSGQEGYGWISSDESWMSDAFLFASAYQGVEGLRPAKMGVIIHEFFHSWGDLEDLYNQAMADDGSLIGAGLGDYCIMATPYGVNGNDEDIPVHLSALPKSQLGWTTPIVINEELTSEQLSDTFLLRPAEYFPDVYRIDLELFERKEYLLLENRQPVEFDKDLPGEGGLMIYRVNEAFQEQKGRGYPSQPGWPKNANDNLYMVAVEQQDGLYELEQGINKGDANDFWGVGTKLGPNTDGTTYPNTDLYSLGDVTPTGVVIEVISQLGDNIVIQVTIPPELWSAPIKEEQASSLAAAPPRADDKLYIDLGLVRTEPIQQSSSSGVGTVSSQWGHLIYHLQAIAVSKFLWWWLV